MTNEDFIKSVSLEGEIWKDVVGYEGKYFISNHGRVITKSPRCGWCFVIGEKPNQTEYLRVDLYSHCKRKRIYIHRLVATHFIDNPFGYNEIDHIDGNPVNNHFLNLRWTTHKENMNNPNTVWKQKLAYKGKYNNENTSKKIVQLKDGILVNIFPSINESKRQGYSSSSVYQCCKGIMLKHRGYQWMYLSDYEKSINKSKNATIVQLTLYPQSDEF
jgi:hypothetical protein